MASSKQRRRRRRRFDHDAPAVALPSSASTAGQPTILRLTACDGSTTHESTVLSPQELTIAREKWPVVWLDVDGFEDLATIRAVGQIFEIGDLALEDAITPDERPKVEVFGHQVLIAVRMARSDGEAIVTDPMAIFLGDRYVITFHDRTVPDGFAGVRERIRHGRTRLGQLGADHLCALLLDAVIDGYFPVLEQFGDSPRDDRGAGPRQSLPRAARQDPRRPQRPDDAPPRPLADPRRAPRPRPRGRPPS